MNLTLRHVPQARTPSASARCALVTLRPLLFGLCGCACSGIASHPPNKGHNAGDLANKDASPNQELKTETGNSGDENSRDASSDRTLEDASEKEAPPNGNPEPDALDASVVPDAASDAPMGDSNTGVLNEPEGGITSEDDGGVRLAAADAEVDKPLVFPSTAILDNFSDPQSLADNWRSSYTYFQIQDGELVCDACSVALLWDETFGPRQEVYTTIVNIGDDTGENDLVLRAQDAYSTFVQVNYFPFPEQIQVSAYVDGEGSSTTAISMHLSLGDQFGARIDEDNWVEVFVNGEKVLTRRVESYPYTSGMIGVSAMINKGNNRYDDFGGGEW